MTITAYIRRRQRSLIVCEWAPGRNDRALESDTVHGIAEWLIGKNGEYALCSACAQLPMFKIFRVRIPLRTAAEAKRLEKAREGR